MSDEHETFNIPLPPPFPPHPGMQRDVLFIRRDADTEAEGGQREHEDIMLRRVPRETAFRFRAAAGGRSLTHAQYLTALVSLHGRIRELADVGDERLAGELAALGLQTVAV